MLFVLLAVPFATQAATEVIVAAVRFAQFQDRVEAIGTLRANESVVLSSSITETVRAMYFDDGDRVAKGTVLLEMTSDEQHAQLQEAKVTLAEAERQYRRVESLQGQGIIPASQMDERRRDWETAKARLAAIESRIENRLIRAPFAGVLGFRNVSVGALVEPGDRIATLDDDGQMKLEFPVPSTYIGSLRVGQILSATSPAFGERVFRGEVKAIDSRIDPVTRAVLVRGVVPNPERLLKPGLLMRVELFRNNRRSLRVPETALLPQGGQQFVLVVDEAGGNTVERREVTAGVRRPGEVEILKGLKEGEKIITHGTIKVRAGEAVTIIAVDDGDGAVRDLTGKKTP